MGEQRKDFDISKVGEVIVGNMCSKTKAKYGIVGLAVNIAQRIQSLFYDDISKIFCKIYQL